VVVLTTREPDGPGGLDHLAFAVPDGPSLAAWAAELVESGAADGEVVDELGKPSLTLTDPDGNRIELVAPPGTW
jgi:catechol-2,3-dioxygenase